MITVYRSDRATAGLVLAHGAGGGQQSSFMVRAAQELAGRGITVATFDFPYVTQGRSVPDKGPVLEAHWRTVVDEIRTRAEFGGLSLFLGGKSMGGRIASQVGAAEHRRHRRPHLLRLSAPSAGAARARRDAHLPGIGEPMLFVQGTRDEFGTSAEIRELLPKLRRAELFEIADGDHSFKTRMKVTGRKPDAALIDAFDAAAAFVKTRSGPTFSAPSA